MVNEDHIKRYGRNKDKIEMEVYRNSIDYCNIYYDDKDEQIQIRQGNNKNNLDVIVLNVEEFEKIIEFYNQYVLKTIK